MSETKKPSIYETLSKIDVKPYIQKKVGLNYLSWAKAWALVKAVYPKAQKEFTKYPEYRVDKDGRYYATGQMLDYRITPEGCEVEATVEIDGQKFSSNLYVMDYRNKVIHKPDLSSINKAQQRALVKALAYAGLGLSVYAGEDLPSDDTELNKRPSRRRPSTQAKKAMPQEPKIDWSKVDWSNPEKISDQLLEQYPVDINGKKWLMTSLVKSVQEGKESAKKFSQGLDGNDAVAFAQIVRRKLVK